MARWPRLAWLHLPAAAWGAWVEFAGKVCPLTPFENRLRAQGGIPAYDSDFIEHYFIPLVYRHGSLANCSGYWEVSSSASTRLCMRLSFVDGFAALESGA